MKIAILETVKATAGFELEYDRIIIETLKKMGHEPVLLVPKDTDLGIDFNVPIIYLSGGKIISYDGAGKIKKIWLSALREFRRVKWFNACADIVEKEKIDLVLITTATYRYLRALKKSRLHDSIIPINFMFLGVNPTEMPKFLNKANDCKKYKNINLLVTTLRDDFEDKLPVNTRLVLPPVMVPDRFMNEKESSKKLKVGFFGHYRKNDKNLDWILSTISESEFNRSVEFIIQVVPTTNNDQIEVEGLLKRYKDDRRISFITDKLIGDEWYKAVSSVDVVFLPYTAERYLYNWSAIYFTAIGCNKPVLVTDTLNPEIMREFNVGEIIDLNTYETFKKQLENFINKYECNKLLYMKNLHEANIKYSKENFISNLISVAR